MDSRFRGNDGLWRRVFPPRAKRGSSFPRAWAVIPAKAGIQNPAASRFAPWRAGRACVRHGCMALRGAAISDRRHDPSPEIGSCLSLKSCRPPHGEGSTSYSSPLPGGRQGGGGSRSRNPVKSGSVTPSIGAGPPDPGTGPGEAGPTDGRRCPHPAAAREGPREGVFNVWHARPADPPPGLPPGRGEECEWASPWRGGGDGAGRRDMTTRGVGTSCEERCGREAPGGGAMAFQSGRSRKPRKFQTETRPVA